MSKYDEFIKFGEEVQPTMADVEGSPLPARQSGLLPCGWCGSSAEDASVPNSPDNPQLVSCSNTKCPLAFGFALPIELWNTRFPDASKVKLPLPTEYLCIDPQGKLDELHLQLCLRCQEAATVWLDTNDVCGLYDCKRGDEVAYPTTDDLLANLRLLASEGFNTTVHHAIKHGLLVRCLEVIESNASKEATKVYHCSCGAACTADAYIDHLFAGHDAGEAVIRSQDYHDAVAIAQFLYNKHYSEVPDWKPLPTLSGTLSQISNMVANLVRSDASGYVRGLEDAAQKVWNIGHDWAIYGDGAKADAAEYVEKAIRALISQHQEGTK